MGAELDRLLENGSVGPTHGQRDQAGEEFDPLRRGIRAPLVRVGALGRSESVRGAFERGPERVATGVAAAVSAVRPAEPSAHTVAEERAQVLVHVLVPAAAERGAVATGGRGVAVRGTLVRLVHDRK